MRFTVAWHPEARSQLESIWIGFQDRNAVTVAADQIDAVLASGGDQVGEEFFGDRLFVQFPLAVVFSVSIEDRMVIIQDVWSWDNES